jgi:TonB family protein
MARQQKVIRKASGRGFSGLLITIALHGGLFAAIAAANSQEKPPLVINRDFVVAEMVKLGKPRDKFWLPRITQPQRSTAPPESIKVAEDPNAKAAPKEAPRPDDPKISKDLRRALDRAHQLEQLAVPDEPEEGSLTGSKLGTSNVETGDQYLAELKGLLMQNYALPAGIEPGSVSSPPEIRFRVGEDGTLSDIKLIKSSGNSFVDDACVGAAQQTRKVSPPPPKFRNHGIGVQCDK